MKRYFTWMLTIVMTGMVLAQDGIVRPTGGPPARGTAARPARPTPTATPVAAPVATAGSVNIGTNDHPNALRFVDAPADMLLNDYARRTGRILLPAPNVPTATTKITLVSPDSMELTDEQYLAAIERILNWNDIVIELEGEIFVTVTPANDPTKRNPDIRETPSMEDEALFQYPEGTGEFVSHMITLKYITIDEGKAVLEGFQRPTAKIQLFERTNSILITDAADNVNRILRIMAFVDIPTPPARESIHVVQIKFAKAADIKARLQELVDAAQGEPASTGPRRMTAPQESTSGSPRTTNRPLPQGVTLPGGRPAVVAEPVPTSTAMMEVLMQDAERGIIRGTVKMVSDERSNILMILTRPENMSFFQKAIDVLDIPATVEVVTEFFRLEHAKADKVASLLNDLISNDAAKRDQPGVATRAGGDGASATLAEAAAAASSRRTQNTAVDASIVSDAAKSRVGQLSKDNIRILPDERANGLLIMASHEDLEAIKDVIRQVDVRLAQVLIEVILVEMNFDNSLDTGVDWVQRVLSGNSGSLLYAGQGGGGTLNPPMNLGTLGNELAGGVSGLSSYFTFPGQRLDVVLRAVATDSKARIMASPIIMTQDNTEGVLTSTRSVYINKGKTVSGYGENRYESSNVDTRDVGLELKVTPMINDTGYVVLNVAQTIQSIIGYQLIDGEPWPTVSERKMGADIAVQNGETVVLGGLAQSETSDTRSKVPILGDIPLLGWFFRSTKKTEIRSEVVVFLTPRVINSNEEAREEAIRRRVSLDTAGTWSGRWSMSTLADPVTAEEAQAMEDRLHDLAPHRVIEAPAE